MPTPADLFASLLFGTIGMAAAIYGWKSALWKPMFIGAAMTVFPYFVDRTWLQYATGCALCVALYVFRD